MNKQRVWCWLDPETVKELQHKAIDHGKRLSEYVADLLEQAEKHVSKQD